MTNKLEIVALGVVSNPGDFVKFSFRSPYTKLKGISLFSPEGFESAYSKRASVELALTCENGDVNLFNDMIGIKRKHLDEKISPIRKLDHRVGRDTISGYAKCLENTTGAPLTLKLYLMYEE